MTEQWLPLPGWEAYYEVSNAGKVRSIERLRPDYRLHTKRRFAGKELNIQTAPNGYSVVYLAVRESGKKRKRAYLHRLVLETFVGPCPDGHWCAHNNGVRSDCRLENLRWDTPANNQADKRKHGTYACGSKIPWSKLTEKEVIKIRKMRGLSDPQIAAKFGVVSQTICSVRNRKTWKHLP